MIDTNTAVPASTTPLRDLGLRESLADPNANDLDKDAFLQLLVAQLRYQDPLNPNDPSEFMATTAQFTVVEKLDELTQQGANTAIISGLSMASSLVGRTITYVGSDDAIATGVVSSAQVSGGEVRLVTDSGVVDLSTVIGIGETATSASAPVSPPATSPAPPEGAAVPDEVAVPSEVAASDAATAGDESPPAAPAAPDPSPLAVAVSTTPATASTIPPTPASAPSQEETLIADPATDTNEPKEPTS